MHPQQILGHHYHLYYHTKQLKTQKKETVSKSYYSQFNNFRQRLILFSVRSSKTFHLGPSPGGVPVNAEPVGSGTPEEGPPVALGGGIWGHVFTRPKSKQKLLFSQ